MTLHGVVMGVDGCIGARAMLLFFVVVGCVCFFFFFKQKTEYEMLRSLVGSEVYIRDSNDH